MGLNIKNERVHALAREAASLTGMSQTSAIEAALELLLRELGADPALAAISQRLDLIQSIATDYASDPGRSDREIVTVEDLFDETGMPR